MTKARWIGLAAGALIVLGVLGVVAWQAGGALVSEAYAQAPTGTPTPQAKGMNWGVAFWNALAKRLGIAPDDLTSKAKEAQKDAVDQAVKDGKLTQAQADQFKKSIDQSSGPVPLLRRFLGLKAPAVPAFLIGLAPDEVEAIAKVLNLTPAELTAQLKNKNLAEVVKARNGSEAAVKQAIVDTAKARLDRLVKDGLMTQAQADQAKSKLDPTKIDLTKIPRQWQKQGQPGFAPGSRGKR